MEKKATRAAAITKVATRAKPAQAAVRTATAIKTAQTVNRPAANTKAAAQKELLEKAKGLIKTDRGIKTLPGVIGHTGGRGVRPGLAEFDPGSVKGPGGRITPPHINPDILNPYLTASGSILPVSPKVISFVYSLDGCASGSSKPNSFDNQWKRGCFYTNAKFRPFFTKDILEQESSNKKELPTIEKSTLGTLGTRDLKEFAGKLRDLSQKTALKMKKK